MEDLNSSWSTFTKGTASSGAVKMKILKYCVICKKWSMYTYSTCTASYPAGANFFIRGVLSSKMQGIMGRVILPSLDPLRFVESSRSAWVQGRYMYPNYNPFNVVLN